MTGSRILAAFALAFVLLAAPQRSAADNIPRRISRFVQDQWRRLTGGGVQSSDSPLQASRRGDADAPATTRQPGLDLEARTRDSDPDRTPTRPMRSDEEQRRRRASEQPYELTTAPVRRGTPTVVFFHGAGQKPDNGVLRRLAEGMRSESVGARIVSLPWQSNRQLTSDVIRRLGPVILAGHSAGGAAALRMAETLPNVRGVVAVNPAGRAQQMPVPTLILRGTNDYMSSPSESGGENVRVVPVEGSDHSLRFRERSQHDKAAHENTPETRNMNRAVARHVGGFLAQLRAPEAP